MEPKELPPKVFAKADEWLGYATILHFWNCDETYYVLAKITHGAGNIYCLRIFPVGGELQLSQDNIIYADNE